MSHAQCSYAKQGWICDIHVDNIYGHILTDYTKVWTIAKEHLNDTTLSVSMSVLITCEYSTCIVNHLLRHTQ